MQIRQDVGDLCGPFRNGSLIDASAGGGAQFCSEIATRNVFHHEVESALGLVIEIVVDRRYCGMIERRKDHRFALEIIDSLDLLLFLDAGLDHLLDGAFDAAEILVHCEINGTHAAAADLLDDRVARVEQCSLCQRFEAGAFATRPSLICGWCLRRRFGFDSGVGVFLFGREIFDGLRRFCERRERRTRRAVFLLLGDLNSAFLTRCHL